jgi:DNA-binding MarR family transcriptional regulator
MTPAATAVTTEPIDAESQLQGEAGKHQEELRVWLRLLTCTNLIEGEIRSRLREHFNTTLPRFDLMAQLERSEDGIMLGELSRRMMVSNGNITGLVDRLVQSGLIERRVSETDRRAARVRLTDLGREQFARMAAAHAEWMAELFAQLDERDREILWLKLGSLKASVRAALAGSADQATNQNNQK